MKTQVKIPAKVNLTLDITGVSGGYHMLNSLVASIDVYDEVTLCSREDKQITMTFTGAAIDIPAEKSIAYKAACTFCGQTGANGADINIYRGIPMGGGLGGSSADAAGVLVGMKKLYGAQCDLKDMAAKLGSDTAYMLEGGFAVLKGRGEKIEKLNVGERFYLLLLTDGGIVSTVECYKRYDDMGIKEAPCTEEAVKAMLCGKEFFGLLKNDLYPPAAEILPAVKENLAALKAHGAALMTGSGSVVYGIYRTEAERDAVYKKLLPAYGKRLIKAQTI